MRRGHAQSLKEGTNAGLEPWPQQGQWSEKELSLRASWRRGLSQPTPRKEEEGTGRDWHEQGAEAQKSQVGLEGGREGPTALQSGWSRTRMGPLGLR